MKGMSTDHSTYHYYSCTEPQGQLTDPYTCPHFFGNSSSMVVCSEYGYSSSRIGVVLVRVEVHVEGNQRWWRWDFPWRVFYSWILQRFDFYVALIHSWVIRNLTFPKGNAYSIQSVGIIVLYSIVLHAPFHSNQPDGRLSTLLSDIIVEFPDVEMVLGKPFLGEGNGNSLA